MKKVLLIVLSLLLILGGVGGAAYMGILKIPGITPKNKMKKNLYGEASLSLYGDKKDKLPEAKKEPEKPKPVAKKPDPPKPKIKAIVKDPDQGAEAIAEVWTSMKTDQLVKVAAEWKDEDLARVLRNMPPKKVADLLGALDPKRASKLSEVMKDQASIVEPADAG